MLRVLCKLSHSSLRKLTYAKFTTLHYCSIRSSLYRQHGGGNYCGQNDVTVTPWKVQYDKT